MENDQNSGAGKQIAKDIINKLVGAYVKKIKIIAIAIGASVMILAGIMGGGSGNDEVYAAGAESDGVISGGGTTSISLTTTMFDKATFKEALQAYYNRTQNQNFYNNFLSKVDILYDESIKNNVNPELVVVTAKTEGSFTEQGGSFNYWGIGVYNGSSTGTSYSSFAEGIAGYSKVLQQYNYGGKYENSIIEKYEARKNSGCDTTGYGLPGTFSGMQSMYSDLGKHEYGSSGSGGYYYMDPDRAGVTKIYSTHEEFVTKCLDVDGEHAEGTICTHYERGQYTAWQVEKKISVWNDIFGEYGALIGTPTGEGGVGGQEIAQGNMSTDGYKTVFKVGTRTYKNYKQGSGAPWSNHIYKAFNETMASSGCGLTAVAVAATGYGLDVTPYDVEILSRTEGAVLKDLLSYYLGIKVDWVKSNVKAGIIDQLKRGHPAIVHVYNHFYTILSINEEGTKFYVSEVGGFYSGKNANGWIDIDTAMKYKGGIDKYIKIP